MRARTVACALALAIGALLPLGAARVSAETGWVKGEVRLNLRTGPGNQYRILGLVRTGDEVQVLERGEEWTRIEHRDTEGEVKQGWIPEGYLSAEAPPTIRLSQAEARGAALEQELATLRESSEKLRGDHQALATQDGEQKSQIQKLTMENMELRAGARYPEWITGASIFAAGMVLGAWLHRNSSRRQPSRIRL